jgi:hypothetical protein
MQWCLHCPLIAILFEIQYIATIWCILANLRIVVISIRCKRCDCQAVTLLPLGFVWIISDWNGLRWYVVYWSVIWTNFFSIPFNTPQYTSIPLYPNKALWTGKAIVQTTQILCFFLLLLFAKAIEIALNSWLIDYLPWDGLTKIINSLTINKDLLSHFRVKDHHLIWRISLMSVYIHTI